MVLFLPLSSLPLEGICFCNGLELHRFYAMIWTCLRSTTFYVRLRSSAFVCVRLHSSAFVCMLEAECTYLNTTCNYQFVFAIHS